MSNVDTSSETEASSPSLQEKIAKLQARIESVKNKNNELQDEISNLQSKKRSFKSRLDRLQRENERLKQSPNFVATVQELLPNNEVLIKQHGNNQEVVTEVTREMHEKLDPESRVTVDNSLNVVGELQSETDVRAQVMQVTESPDVTYEDIGGLDSQMQEIRETVEKPLTAPEEFDRVGIDPPTGVLLHGPPGTGKTLIAKAVAEQTDATIIQLSGSDLGRKFIGEGAKLVRELFEYAREEQPAIIFIDELDAIATKRTESKTSGDAEIQRTLMQLLNEMDGFEQRGDISIIGATNRPDMLDEAVVRPGRFDRRVEVPAPDAQGRKEILQIHTREMNLTDDVDIEELVEITDEMTGAQINSICTEAGMFALRNDKTTVTHEDFVNAHQKVTDEEDTQVNQGEISTAFA